MAQSLLAAFDYMGTHVDIPCTLRSRDGVGDGTIQANLLAKATALIPQIITQGRDANWQAWVTYHSYYKAPDLIGPAVSRALGVPYLLIEGTRARKRLGGAWDAFARAAEAACDAADVVFYLTERDHEALAKYAPQSQRLIHLRPFLSQTGLPRTAHGTHFLSVGMMRVAAKLPSYQIIADVMALLPETTQLEIAGDGPARAQVEAAMAPLANRVRFLGALDPDDLAAAYARAGALIWPGVDEAFGMTYLEAQAYGLPVIAQDRPGVRDVLYPRTYPSVDAGAAGMAEFAMIPAPAPDDIRAYMAKHHLLPAAAKTLRTGLRQVGVT
ncbi:glycosyltransferase [uncultured Sulfitobacter sp.]|uniref:glycosyltransferase n=1 Tax=uncultured Sulfitobacter sp. TaxID=191468 RepID=UPI0026110D1F|nr:glycosyltransferase [uncultured Sulfitobacter sp.]